MDKKSFGLILLFITIFLLAVFILLTIEDLKTEKIDKNSISKVTNISDFYVVEDCVNKYVSYLNSKDFDKVYALLDDNYIEKNNITKDNISNYLVFFNKNYNLKIDSMYKYKGLNIYYVKGKLIEEVMDNFEPDEKDFKTTIKLDKDSNKFSVIPDGDGGAFDD